MKRLIFIFALLLGNFSSGFATTYYSKMTGNSNSDMWAYTAGGAIVPGARPGGSLTDIIHIQATHTVTFNASITIDDLFLDATTSVMSISSGCTVKLNGSGGTFNNSNTNATTSWWAATSAGTFDMGTCTSNIARFYASTTIAATAKIICSYFTVDGSKTLNINGTLETTSTTANTVTGTINNAGTVISYGNLAGTGTFNNSAGAGGTLKLKGSLAPTGAGKIMGNTTANTIHIESTGNTHNFGTGNDLNQTTISIGTGVQSTYSLNVVTNAIKVKRITFNNTSSPNSNLNVSTADVTVYNLDGGSASGAFSYVTVGAGRTLTIEGPGVTGFGSTPGDFLRGTGTVYFASGLDAFTGWTKADQVVPSVSTSGAREVIYHGKLKIRTDGNIVTIGSTGAMAPAYMEIQNDLEIFATALGGTVTTGLAANKYILVGSGTAATPGTIYFSRDAAGANVNPLTLNIYHRFLKNGGSANAGTFNMGNAASTINVYYENTTYPAIDNYNYATLYGTVNYLGQAAGTVQLAIPASNYNMNINRNAVGHVTKLAANSEVRNTLTLTQGTLEIDNWLLTLSGTISNVNGYLGGTASSSLTASGVGACGTIRFETGKQNLGILIFDRTGGSGSLNLGSDLTIATDINVNEGAFILNANTLTLNGTYERAGARVGTFTGSASSNMIINGSGNLGDPIYFTDGSQALNNLTLNRNTSGIVLLGTNLSIYGNGTFTDGIMQYNAGTERLTFVNGANSNGGSLTSYVDGQVIKQGNTPASFMFPVGDGGVWAPAKIENVTASDNYYCEYVFSAPADRTNKDANLASVSNVEYWQLSRDGATECDVTLYYKDATRSGIPTPKDSLAIVHYATKWENLKGTIVDEGGGTGHISQHVSSFSPFTLGTKGGGSPMPVGLVSFETNCKNGRVMIEWTTASESNNDYFTLEKSVDGRIFTPFAKIKGAGNSSDLINYSHTDPEVLAAINYYRLKQTDYDGKFEYFGPVKTSCNDGAACEMSVFPNPFNNVITISFQGIESKSATVIVYNVIGNQIKKEIITGISSGTIDIDLSQHGQGIYYVEFTSAEYTRIIKTIKR